MSATPTALSVNHQHSTGAARRNPPQVYHRHAGQQPRTDRSTPKFTHPRQRSARANPHQSVPRRPLATPRRSRTFRPFRVNSTPLPRPADGAATEVHTPFPPHATPTPQQSATLRPSCPTLRRAQTAPSVSTCRAHSSLAFQARQAYVPAHPMGRAAPGFGQAGPQQTAWSQACNGRSPDRQDRSRRALSCFALPRSPRNRPQPARDDALPASGLQGGSANQDRRRQPPGRKKRKDRIPLLYGIYRHPQPRRFCGSP